MGSLLDSQLVKTGISTATPGYLTASLHSLPVILHMTSQDEVVLTWIIPSAPVDLECPRTRKTSKGHIRLLFRVVSGRSVGRREGEHWIGLLLGRDEGPVGVEHGHGVGKAALLVGCVGLAAVHDRLVHARLDGRGEDPGPRDDC
jgi:hypothetical protein